MSSGMIYSFYHIGALFIIERSFTMSEKRRDNRGRILHNGESQRQDGRYVYKYKDLNGDTKFVYSWIKTTGLQQEKRGIFL